MCADLYAHTYINILQADLFLLCLPALKKERTRLCTLGRDRSLWSVTGRGGWLPWESGVGGRSMTCRDATSPCLALLRAGALTNNSGPSGAFLLVC